MAIKNPPKTLNFPVSSIFTPHKKGGLKVTRTVAPGRPGAVRELAKYGSKMLAVRYLKNDNGRYVKTVELIVAERNET